MKRLIRKADNTKIIINSINNLVQSGRGVLKSIENYKFQLTQSEKMMQSNETLLTKLQQKEKILDSASAQIYGIIFDLENFDLTPNYSNEQLSLTTVNQETSNNQTTPATTLTTPPAPAAPSTTTPPPESSTPTEEDSEDELEENIKETDDTEDSSNKPDDDKDETTKDGLKMQGNV